MPFTKKSTLGVLTLGQSPRDDVTPTLRAILGSAIDVREAGGLDDLSREELETIVPGEGETAIETRLASGAAILVARELLVPRIAAAFDRLSEDCARVLLLCSGEFPALTRRCPGLIQPVAALRAIVASLASASVLGIVGPASDMEAAPAQWKPYAASVLCSAASPYDPMSTARDAGKRLAAAGADLVFLDDMAFTEGHRREVALASGLPVLCASTLTARFLFESFPPDPSTEDPCPPT